MKHHALWKAAAACCAIFGLQSQSYAIDSASIELGGGENVRMIRVGGQWKWKQHWWQSDGRHIGGYWDLTLSGWRGDKYQNISNQTQDIVDFGFTPVFRYQRNDFKGAYLEAGIGAHYLSKNYNNSGRRLSTHFQFGDHIGIGYVFQNNWDFALKFQHFSNGGIKNPNNGVDFIVLRASYPF